MTQLCNDSIIYRDFVLCISSLLILLGFVVLGFNIFYKSKIDSLEQEICYKSQEYHKYKFCEKYDK